MGFGFARGGLKRKEPAASYSRTGGSRTTLGDGGLDFRVRNGNGYFSPSVATGKKPESRRLERTATHTGRRDAVFSAGS